jgi:signal transduction histidine kinase
MELLDARLATLRRESDKEIRRLNLALEARARELEAALRELEFFTYTVAHDLRSPLRALGGFSELIRAEYGQVLDDTGQGYLSRISEAARRMDALVADLLAYSRAAREEIILEDVDVGWAIDEAVTQVSAGGETRGSIETDGARGVLRAHRPMLIQVVVNLLSNALKFVPPGVLPRVRVRSEERGPTLRLWVEDNGIGIHPDHHRKIFDVFQRLHRSEAYRGTGIGLAIVKRGVERMGGTLGLESAPGEGSRFWIEFPRGVTKAAV